MNAEVRKKPNGRKEEDARVKKGIIIPEFTVRQVTR